MPFLYKDNKYDQVGLSDGEQLTYSRNAKTPITIEGTILSENSDLTVAETRDHLISLLSGNVTKQLKLSNYPDRYFDAIFEGTQEYDGTFDYIAKVDLVFMVPDGIAHSVATKTADNTPYKDVPVNLLKGSGEPQTVAAKEWGDNPYLLLDTSNLEIGDIVSFQVKVNGVKDTNLFVAFNGKGISPSFSNGMETFAITWTKELSELPLPIKFSVKTAALTDEYTWSQAKAAIGTTASPWSPNPADPEYYADTITVHNGGTYPVEPVITATMNADNGFLGFANSQGGVLQFGNPEEIDGYTSEESEVALNLAAVQGSHMDNQAASNNLCWGDNPATPNEQIGNAIWTQDSYDGWKVEPNWPSIIGDHKYWNGPSIKHNLAQTHNGNFKSNLTWDVMTRFQTGVSKVGSLETTLESDGKPIFQMILKDNSALSDQIWWMCYYKNQLVVNEQLDRNIFTNDKFIQLELQKFGNSVVFRVSPWVGNRGRETTITRQFTFSDAASVETKQFSAWFMRDKTWGESTMYLIASTVKWQNVSWYTDIKNRFSNGDVITVDVANTKTYFNGSEDRTLHTLGNQWDKFLLPPGDTTIKLMPSSWAKPFACEVNLKEAWL
nr:distal tail protein Dit [Lacticaseibacillus paracasei]